MHSDKSKDDKLKAFFSNASGNQNQTAPNNTRSGG